MAQLSWDLQHLSSASHGSSPGQPPHPTPQYFPYRMLMPETPRQLPRNQRISHNWARPLASDTVFTCLPMPPPFSLPDPKKDAAVSKWRGLTQTICRYPCRIFPCKRPCDLARVYGPKRGMCVSALAMALQRWPLQRNGE